MRALVALAVTLSCAAPSSAQLQPMPAPLPAVASPSPAIAWWNPAADYVTGGQDEPGYRRWVLTQPWRQSAVRQFHEYLTASGVSFVSPTWQLLRTASDWQRCGAQPFEVPPSEEWPNIVNTLRYVRDHVVPEVGPVEPVSVFRNSALNRCAGGAPESVHKSMSAIDFVPLRPIDRNSLIHRLCAEHQQQGPRYNAGLGFYTKLRFHVDSWKYRTWGRGDHGEVACPKVLPPPVDLLASRSTPVTGAATIGTAATAAPASPPAPGEPARDPLAPLASGSGTAGR